MNAFGDDNHENGLGASVVRKGLVDQIITLIRTDIRSGRYNLGQRLPSEGKLSHELGVGRSTIREALKALNLIGLVETINGRGTFVISQASESDSLRNAVSIESIPKLMEIVEFRCMIEVEAAYWASQRVSSKQITEIQGIWNQYSQAIKDGSLVRCIRLDADFHTAIVRASRNQFILRAYENLRDEIEWVGNIIFSGGPLDRKKDVHQDLLRGLEERNPILAVKAVRQDFEHLNTYIRTLIAQQPEAVDRHASGLRIGVQSS